MLKVSAEVDWNNASGCITGAVSSQCVPNGASWFMTHTHTHVFWPLAVICRTTTLSVRPPVNITTYSETLSQKTPQERCYSTVALSEPCGLIQKWKSFISLISRFLLDIIESLICVSEISPEKKRGKFWQMRCHQRVKQIFFYREKERENASSQ